MNPDEIREAQEGWDRYAEATSVRNALRVLGPRPELPTEGRGFARTAQGFGDFVKGLGLRAGEGVVSSVAGAAGLADKLVPGEGLGHRIHESLSGTREHLEERVPDSPAGRVGGGVGRLGAELGMAIAPGAGVVKGAKALGAGTRLLPWLGLGTDIAADAAIEAGQKPEDSLASFLGLEGSAETLGGRALVGGLTAGAVGTVFEGVRGVRGLRADRAATQADELDILEKLSDEELLNLPSRYQPRARHSGLAPRDPDDSISLLAGAGNDPLVRDITAETKLSGHRPKSAIPQDPTPDKAFRRPEHMAQRIDGHLRNIRALDAKLATMSPARNQAGYKGLQRQRDVTEAVMRDEIMDYFGGLSEAGRSLAYHRFRVSGTNTLTGLHRHVSKALGNGLTPGQMDELQKFITFAPDGESIAKLDAAGIARWIQDSKSPLSWGDPKFWTDMIRSGMLSALYSPLRAVVGNTASIGAQTVGAPARVLSDGIMTYWARRVAGLEHADKITRTFTGANLGERLRAGRRGAKQGVKDIPGIMRHGFDANDPFGGKLSLERLDDPTTNFETGFTVPFGKTASGEQAHVDVGNVWGQLWFRLQGAADTPFRKAVAQMSLQDQAEIIARHYEKLDPDKGASFLKSRGMSADDAKALAAQTFEGRVQHLVENPSMPMIGRAMEEAAFTAFQNDTALNDIIQAIRQGLRHGEERAVGNASSPGGKLAQAAFDLTVPFARTPSAITARVVGASPFGAVADALDFMRILGQAKALRTGTAVDPEIAVELIQEHMTKLGRRVGDQVAATATLAGVFFAMGREGFNEGWVTGGMPTAPEERSQFLREGKIPYGLLVKDRYYSVAQAAPVGHMLAMGAAFAEWEREQDEALRRGEEAVPGLTDLVGDVGLTVLDVVQESPFFQGVQRIEDVQTATDAAKEGRGLGPRATRALAQFPASAVPNLVASVARTDDPIRLKRNEPFGAAVKDAVVERIPGLSWNLPPRVDRLTGDELTRENSTAARLASLFDPFASSPDRTKDDPTLAALHESGAAPSDPAKLPSETSEDYNARLADESPDVRRALGALFGTDRTMENLQLLMSAGVSPADLVEYEQLAQAPETPETRAAKDEIVTNAITRVRRLITRRRELAERYNSSGGG